MRRCRSDINYMQLCPGVDLPLEAGTCTTTAARPSTDFRFSNLDILREARRLGDGTGLVFPSRRGKTLSDMTLSKLLKEQRVKAVPHGFRSSFRDWAAERTHCPREVVEAALAHVVSNATEAAYARSNLFDRRRRLMEDWAAYLGEERAATAMTSASASTTFGRLHP